MIIPILELKNINLTVSGFSLNDINLTIYPGETHILMGENGSGKSLIMQIISGTLPPDSGEIKYQGMPYKYRAFSNIALKEIMYVSQNLTLMEHVTVAENLFFRNLTYKNKFFPSINHDLLNKKLTELIKEFDLPISPYEKVANLGLAQRQMLEFCKAYISESRVLILDEPSDALNSVEKEILYKIVKKIKERGTSIFFITHQIDDVFRIGDRVTILRNGTIVDCKTVKNTSQEEIIRSLSSIHIEEKYPKIKNPKGNIVMKVTDLSFEDKLSNINFNLREGEIMGITGMAGSGRTLLARCLFGVAKYSGEVMIKGKKVTISSPQVAIKNGIAFLSDNRLEDSIFLDLNTDENVAFPSLHRFSRNKIINSTYLEQTVYQYIKKINIPIFKNPKISSYSGGSLQKVLFAKWIMSRADIFILDEPTHGVDLASKVDIYNFINDMVKKKVAIIFISSDIEEILGICDRVAVLSNQTFVCDISTKNTTAEELIKFATTGKKNEPIK